MVCSWDLSLVPEKLYNNMLIKILLVFNNPLPKASNIYIEKQKEDSNRFRGDG